jgi:hypothetical protein
MSPPVVPLQVLQQRKMFFEPFQTFLAHGGLRFPPPDQSMREAPAVFPGKDGGRAADLSQA